MYKWLSMTLFYFLLINYSEAQQLFPESGKAFDESEVPRVDIKINNSDLDIILLGNLDSNVEYPAQFIYSTSYSSDTINNVGFRLRGNTSREKIKKSFKVSFNTFKSGQKWEGLEKLNLNGESNDPSLLRSKLGWNLFRHFSVPAARCNHVELYINNEYKGLYLNTEHIDEEFIKKRFTYSDGNLYKCLWPADMNYKGSDPDNYKEEFWGRKAYELKTNTLQEEYKDLAYLIDVLNNYNGIDLICTLEKILNVDLLIRCLAIDVYIGNWDGAFLNKNNFYLYNDPSTGVFTFIPYDLDNTFGIDWINKDWTTAPLYVWSSLSGESRPLYETILNIPEYNNRFGHYLSQISNYLETDTLTKYLEDKIDLLQESRIADTFSDKDYGFSFEDFTQSIYTGFGAHVPYGISEYLNRRYSYVKDNIQELNNIPSVSICSHQVHSDSISFDIGFHLSHLATNVNLHYQYDTKPEISTEIEITNDISRLSIERDPEAKTLSYYITMTYGPGLTRHFPFCKDAEIPFQLQENRALVINEFLANNYSSQTDETGEHEDWLELYNSGNQRINLSQYYLTDNPNNPNQWRLPSLFLYPAEYIVFWMDKDKIQGENHANFKLAKDGEFLGLYTLDRGGYLPIDTLTFKTQQEDLSSARIPNGIGAFKITNRLTFNTNNDLPSKTKETIPIEYHLHPNPTTGLLTISSEGGLNYTIEVFDTVGQQISITKNSPKIISLKELKSGAYLIKITTKDKITCTPIVKY